MAHLFDRWHLQGVPVSLRWWIPSPAPLSLALHRGHDPPLATTFAAACALITGVLLALPFALLGRSALASVLSRQNMADIVAALCVFMTLGLPLVAVTFSLSRTRPQVSRTFLALSAVATLAWGLGDPGFPIVVALAAIVVGAILLVRPSPRVRAVLRRTSVALLVVASVAAFALILANLVASQRAEAAWKDSAIGLLAALIVGALLLALGVLMLAVQRADHAFWSTPASWQPAELTQGNVLRFASGGASRQAPDAFAGYTGPVVVITSRASPRGVFRADDAPDDGWTVPGTIDTVHEAVARSEHAALATLIIPLACAATLLSAGLWGTLKILFS